MKSKIVHNRYIFTLLWQTVKVNKRVAKIQQQNNNNKKKRESTTIPSNIILTSRGIEYYIACTTHGYWITLI